MTPSDYVSEAAERMRADGSTVASANLGRFDATVGYQSKFKVRWFATKLHTCTVRRDGHRERR